MKNLQALVYSLNIFACHALFSPQPFFCIARLEMICTSQIYETSKSAFRQKSFISNDSELFNYTFGIFEGVRQNLI